MSRMVCTKCQTFLHPKQNGVIVEEGMPTGPDRMTWVPYKLWMADAWECRSCGFEIITGFGFDALCHHFMPNYKAMKAEREPVVFVKDCL